MIKPWLFEFFPELGDEARDAAPAEMADYATRYLDLWARYGRPALGRRD